MSNEKGSSVTADSFIVLGERSKVLKTPSRFIGRVETAIEEKTIVTSDLKSVKTCNLRFNPGLFKIVEEPLDNALDECKRNNGIPGKGDTIMVNVDKDGQWLSISDNGNGIPTQEAVHEESGKTGMPIFQAAWCKLGAGQNFDGYTNDDSEARGQNGEGVCLTNIFSKEFQGLTQYGDEFVTLICKNNMETTNVNIVNAPGKPSGTTVRFLPDYARFGETQFDISHQYLLMYYLAIMSIEYPKYKFYFNGMHIKYTQEMLIDGYTQGKKGVVEILKVDGLNIIVLPSDKPRFSLFINGSDTAKGGNPIEWVIKKVTESYVKNVPNKMKGIKASFVEQNMHIIAMFDKIVKPRFEGQTKNLCTTPYKDFKGTIDEKGLDWNAFAKRLIKNKSISNAITIRYEAVKKGEEKLKAGKDEKARKEYELPPKFQPASKVKKYFVAAEGDSAIDSLSANAGRQDKAFFPVGGKPLNIYKNKSPKITGNVEFKAICSKDLLDLSFTKDNTKMNYEHFVAAMDADPDGIHIIGLYLGFFNKISPQTLIDGKFSFLQTPLVMAKNKKEVTEKFFLSQYEFDSTQKEALKKYDLDYKKGLGSISEIEFEEIFENYTFEDLLVKIVLRDPEKVPEGYMKDIETMELWLGDDTDFRKRAINGYVDHMNLLSGEQEEYQINMNPEN